MPATHRIDNTDKLLITTWTGKATDAELIDALKKYQENYLCHPDYINYNEVVNFSDATEVQLTTMGLKNIGEIATTTDQAHIKKKLAFIVSSNKAYFLARMYIAYRSLFQKSNKEIRVFTKEDVAFWWIKTKT